MPAAGTFVFDREPARQTANSGVKLDAEAYSSLGKYNPCIFIACEGK